MKSIIPSRTVVSKRAHYDCTHDWMWYHLRQRYEYLFLTLIMQHIFSFNHFWKIQASDSMIPFREKNNLASSLQGCLIITIKKNYICVLEWFVYLYIGIRVIRCKIRNITFWFLYCRYLTWVSTWSVYSQLMPFIVSMN